MHAKHKPVQPIGSLSGSHSFLGLEIKGPREHAAAIKGACPGLKSIQEVEKERWQKAPMTLYEIVMIISYL